jgi:magnesium transporter
VIESFSDQNDILILFQLYGNNEDKANLLSHLNSHTQQIVIQQLKSEKVVSFLSDMDTDDAADLLGHLDDDKANELLKLMDKSESEEVSDLMGYPEDSAGGIMNSDFLSFQQSMTVEQSIKKIQDEDSENSVAFYIYVTNEENQLLGVLSLKQLLLSKKSVTLKELMTKDVITVGLETSQDQVAKLVERYDFLALPVVSNSNELMGIITVDDVLDVIRESAEEDLLKMGQAGDLDGGLWDNLKNRSSWLALSFLGGSICFLVIFLIGNSTNFSNQGFINLWLFASFIPLLLSLGGTVGSQISTKIVSLLRGSSVDFGKVKKVLRQEFYATFILSCIFSLIIMLLGVSFFSDYLTVSVLAIALFFHLLIVVSLGATLPVLAQKIGVDSITSSVPMYTIVTDILGVLILFSTVKILIM